MQGISVLGLIFTLVGLVVIGFAEELSLFERRMVEKYPATRVTGWSGTRKGTISWQVVGLLLVVLGLAYEILPFLLFRHR